MNVNSNHSAVRTAGVAIPHDGLPTLKTVHCYDGGKLATFSLESSRAKPRKLQNMPIGASHIKTAPPMTNSDSEADHSNKVYSGALYPPGNQPRLQFVDGRPIIIPSTFNNKFIARGTFDPNVHKSNTVVYTESSPSFSNMEIVFYPQQQLKDKEQQEQQQYPQQTASSQEHQQISPQNSSPQLVQLLQQNQNKLSSETRRKRIHQQFPGNANAPVVIDLSDEEPSSSGTTSSATVTTVTQSTTTQQAPHRPNVLSNVHCYICQKGLTVETCRTYNYCSPQTSELSTISVCASCAADRQERSSTKGSGTAAPQLTTASPENSSPTAGTNSTSILRKQRREAMRNKHNTPASSPIVIDVDEGDTFNPPPQCDPVSRHVSNLSHNPGAFPNNSTSTMKVNSPRVKQTSLLLHNPQNIRNQLADRQINNTQTLSSPKTSSPRAHSPLRNSPRMGNSQMSSQRVSCPQINSPRVNSPRMNSPRMNSPRMNSPRINSPQINSPQLNSPSMNSPGMNNSHMSSQRVSCPPMNSPRMNSPRRNSPRMNSPRMNSPRMNRPQMNSPRINNPQISVPQMNSKRTTPPQTISYQTSSAQVRNLVMTNPRAVNPPIHSKRTMNETHYISQMGITQTSSPIYCQMCGIPLVPMSHMGVNPFPPICPRCIHLRRSREQPKHKPPLSSGKSKLVINLDKVPDSGADAAHVFDSLELDIDEESFQSFLNQGDSQSDSSLEVEISNRKRKSTLDTPPSSICPSSSLEASAHKSKRVDSAISVQTSIVIDENVKVKNEKDVEPTDSERHGLHSDTRRMILEKTKKCNLSCDPSQTDILDSRVSDKREVETLATGFQDSSIDSQPVAEYFDAKKDNTNLVPMAAFNPSESKQESHDDVINRTVTYMIDCIDDVLYTVELIIANVIKLSVTDVDVRMITDNTSISKSPIADDSDGPVLRDESREVIDYSSAPVPISEEDAIETDTEFAESIEDSLCSKSISASKIVSSGSNSTSKNDIYDSLSVVSNSEIPESNSNDTIADDYSVSESNTKNEVLLSGTISEDDNTISRSSIPESITASDDLKFAGKVLAHESVIKCEPNVDGCSSPFCESAVTNEVALSESKLDGAECGDHSSGLEPIFKNKSFISESKFKEDTTTNSSATIEDAPTEGQSLDKIIVSVGHTKSDMKEMTHSDQIEDRPSSSNRSDEEGRPTSNRLSMLQNLSLANLSFTNKATFDSSTDVLLTATSNKSNTTLTSTLNPTLCSTLFTSSCATSVTSSNVTAEATSVETTTNTTSFSTLNMSSDAASSTRCITTSDTSLTPELVTTPRAKPITHLSKMSGETSVTTSKLPSSDALSNTTSSTTSNTTTTLHATSNATSLPNPSTTSNTHPLSTATPNKFYLDSEKLRNLRKRVAPAFKAKKWSLGNEENASKEL